ncbi:TPA: fimbrial chaperone [Salmonella enterica subsp. diarizonae]|nr:fimbrial chaperone [Salmonella enterica subsp. diarizonae]
MLGITLGTMFVSSSMAAFSLNGTRFIYEEGKKNISFEVSNSEQETYGGQVWIDNVSQNKADVFVIPSPPFFKVGSKGKQNVRLMLVNPVLPSDRESLFHLNVQEIPPKPDDTDGSVLAIAMNTQVKLIYRPKVLIEGRKDAEKRLVLVNRDGSVWIENPTPYYFAVTKVNQQGKEVKLSAEAQRALAQFPPFSEVDTGMKILREVSVDTINDWGGVDKYDVKTK